MLYAGQVFYSIQWTLGAIRQTLRFISPVSLMIKIQFCFYIKNCEFCEKMRFLQKRRCLTLSSHRGRVRPTSSLFQVKLDSWVCAGSLPAYHFFYLTEELPERSSKNCVFITERRSENPGTLKVFHRRQKTHMLFKWTRLCIQKIKVFWWNKFPFSMYFFCKRISTTRRC